MKRIVILMTLLALCSCLAGCKPYKVLAGELSLDNGGLDYTIDKSKVEITLKENKSVKIPLVIKNNGAEAEFTIMARTPDFTADGFAAVKENSFEVAFSQNNITINVCERGKIDIEVKRNKGFAAPTEIWVSIKDNSKALIHKELILRILVNVK